MRDLTNFRALLSVAALPTASTTLRGISVLLTTDNNEYYCDGTSWLPRNVTFSTTQKGLVPASGTASTTKYLRDDATWNIPYDPRLQTSRLTSDVSVKSTTSINTGLSVSLESNSVYILDGAILFLTSNTSCGIKLGITVPSDADVDGTVFTPTSLTAITTSNQVSSDTGTTSTTCYSTSVAMMAQMKYIIQTGSTAGVAMIRFASESGSHTATVKANSSIYCVKV